MSAFAGKEFCCGEADTLSTASNDSHFPAQFTHSSFSLLVVSICNIGGCPGPRSCEVFLSGRRHRCGGPARRAVSPHPAFGSTANRLSLRGVQFSLSSFGPAESFSGREGEDFVAL